MMPRFVLLLAISAVLAVLAFQNKEPVALSFLSQSLPAIAFGLQLVIAVGIGALLTIVLYGLVGGKKRPPESQYRPMGRRVPPSDTPPATPAYGTEPSVGSSYDSYNSGAYGTSGGSTAFVEDATPAASPTVDPPPQSSPQSSPQSEPDTTGSWTDTEPPVAYASPTVDSPTSTNSPSGAPLLDSLKQNVNQSVSQLSDLSRKPIDGLKSVLNRKSHETDAPPPTVGEDWGQVNPRSQQEEWNTSGADSSPFDRFRNRTANLSSEAATDDLDQGWDPYSESGRYDDATSDDNRYRRTYQDSLYEHGYDEGYDDRINGADTAPEEYEENVYDADYRVIVPPAKPLDEPATNGEP